MIIIMFSGSVLMEGNLNPNTSSNSEFTKSSFGWKGGKDRQTTGIWMWSEPYYYESSYGELAILLVDTQGMFDNDTTMHVTAQIFGLTTLVSSYQICK